MLANRVWWLTGGDERAEKDRAPAEVARDADMLEGGMVGRKQESIDGS